MAGDDRDLGGEDTGDRDREGEEKQEEVGELDDEAPRGATGGRSVSR